MKVPHNKLTYEKVKEYIENENCLLLDENYINNETKMDFICSCGEKFNTTFSKFKNRGQRCRECGKLKYSEKRKFSFEFVKNYFENEGCKLLEDKYEDIFANLNYICSCGNPSVITFNAFKNANSRCKQCGIDKMAKTQSTSYEEVLKIFIDGRCKLLEKEYINNSTQMNYICECGEPSTITLESFKKDRRCKKCGIKKMVENQRHPFRYVSEYFTTHGCELLDKEYINTSTPLNYICSCGNKSKISFSTFQNGVRCDKCAKERLSGEGHWNWQGGITPLYRHLRGVIFDWRNESLRKHNYTCDISGFMGSLEIHHLYPFNKILQETMNKLNLPIYDAINRYTSDEMNIIEQTCINLHYGYGLGVPLIKEIHDEFHFIYGRLDFTPEDFEEFKQMKLLQSVS